MKNISCLFILLFTFAIGNSQLSSCQEIFKHVQEIIFDTSGRMLTFPRTFVTPKTQFKFKVSVPGNAYQPWISQLQRSLSRTQKYLDGPEVKELYNCFFGESLDYDNFNRSALKIDSLITSCDRDRLDTQIKKLGIHENLIPITLLLDNVQKQYQVKIYRNDLCLDNVPLIFVQNCEGNCTEFSSKLVKVEDSSCTSCVTTTTDEFRFELIYTNPWDQTLREWYRMKAVAFVKEKRIQYFTTFLTNIDSLDSQRTTLDSLEIQIKRFDLIMSKLTNHNSFISTLIRFDSVKVEVQRNLDRKLKMNIDDLLLLHGWFINWFWFNGGKLELDPFNIIPDARRKRFSEQIASKDSSLVFLNEKLIFLDSVKRLLTKTLPHLNDMDLIHYEEMKIVKQMAQNTAEKAKLQNLLKIDPLLARLSSKMMIYQGHMELSASLHDLKNRRINAHKQFDAYRGFRPISVNLCKRRKVSEIPENERMHIAVHNIPSNVKIKVEEKRLSFTDQEEFTALVREQLSKIDFSSLGQPVIRSVENFISSFGPTEVKDLVPLGDSKNTTTSCVSIMNDLVKRLLDEIKSEAVYPPDTSYFKQMGIKGPAFRTHISPISDFEAPFRDSITIKAIYPKDSVVVAAKTFVKVGKLRIFQLMAGIAVMKEPVSVTRIDTIGGGFRVSTSDNAAKAIFGFKIYPFKNYNRDHGIIPRYPLRRFSLLAGAELLRPLDNFYLGGSYDLIPGLAVSLGTNFNLQTTYQVQNNAIVNTSRRYQQSGTFYAVSVNPVLFVQFVKLFFK